jgi:hypothetical protein
MTWNFLQNGKRRLSGGVESDTIWVSPSSRQGDNAVNNDGDDDDDDNASFDNSPGGFYDDDDDDKDYQSNLMDENSAPNEMNRLRNNTSGNGLIIQVEGGLLEAPRKVSKMNIG